AFTTSNQSVEGIKGANLSYDASSPTTLLSAYTSVTLKPNTNYVLSAYAKTTALGTNLTLMADGVILCQTPITTVPFARYNCTGSTGSSVTNAFVNITMTPSSAQSTILDAIQLEEGTVPGPFAGGGGDAPNITVSFRRDNATVEFLIIPRWNGTDNKSRMFIDAQPLVIGKGIFGEHTDLLVAGFYNGAAWESIARYNISHWRVDDTHHIRFATSIAVGGAWLFVDGFLANRTPWSFTGTFPAASDVIVGAAQGSRNQSDAIFDELRIYNRALPFPAPVTANLTPGRNYNTLGSSGIDIVWNATDPRDGEYNIQNPVRITIAGVNDPPSVGPNDPNGNPIPASPAGCDPLAYPLSPQRCIFYNGSILDRDILEDTNFSMNVSPFIFDAEDRFVDLNITVINATSDWTIDLNQTRGIGNITFLPRENFNGHTYFRLNVTDLDGNSTLSNEFLINVLPINDTVRKNGTIGLLNLTRDSEFNISLRFYFIDDDGDVLYGYSYLGNPAFNVTINATNGNVTINPPPGFLGNTTLNFTAYDGTAGVLLQENVTLNVTPRIYPSTLINTTIDGVLYNAVVINVPSINDANLTHDVVALSELTFVVINQSNITRSNITNSSAFSSFFFDTYVRQSTIRNTTTQQSNITLSTITNSVVNASWINNSRLYNATLRDTNMSGSNATHSLTNHSLIIHSTLIRSNLTLANTTNSTIYDSTVFNTSLVNTTVNSSTMSSYTARLSLIINSSLSSDYLANITTSTMNGGAANATVVHGLTISSSTGATLTPLGGAVHT
ncbi:MAG: hypothetical protein AABY13_04560, partial [Nanoarchaeota archaeon]